jgi:hypothetical protein
VCKVEVVAPWDRETISGGKYNDYKVSVYFIGGYGSKNWPRTQAVIGKEEKVMDEIWLVVYNMFGVNVDLYTKYVEKCEDSEMIKESDDRTKSLLNKVLRRVNNLDSIVDEAIDWCVSHISHSVLKKAGIQWFVDKVIFNVYIDYVSQEFEYWGEEGELEEPEIRITKEEEENIMKFLERHYYDKIKKRYIDEFGDEEQITEDTEMIKESVDMPIQLRRRLMDFDEDKIINYLRKFAIKYFKPERTIDTVVNNACFDTSYELIESVSLDMDDETFREIEQKLTDYLKEKYGEYVKDFIENLFDESGDEMDAKYVFWKHEDRYGGNGFSDTFQSWNDLLRNFGSWFPDLDWKKIKNKLDGMVGQPLIIKKPGDKNNNMGYYFSLIKK